MESKRLPWFRRAATAFVFGLNTATLLFVVTALPFAIYLYSAGGRDLSLFVFGCFPIAAATITLAGLTFVLPNLVEGNELRFPLNFTLPTVYGGLELIMSHVMATLRPPIALIGEEARVDQFWGQDGFLVAFWFDQVIALTIAIALRNRRERSN